MIIIIFLEKIDIYLAFLIYFMLKVKHHLAKNDQEQKYFLISS